MAKQSSSYSVSNPVCENHEIRVCPVAPMNVPNTEKTGLLQPLFLSWKYIENTKNLLPFRPKYVVVNQKKSEETVWSAYS